MAEPLEPVGYMILDAESGNAVAFYDSWEEAEKAIRETIQNRPREEFEELVLIAYDKIGNPVRSVSALEFVAA